MKQKGTKIIGKVMREKYCKKGKKCKKKYETEKTSLKLLKYIFEDIRLERLRFKWRRLEIRTDLL